MKIAERLALSPELRDQASWPVPPRITESQKSLYETRKAAIRAYLDGEPLVSIKRKYGIAKSEVYRLLGRCLTVQAGGDILGYYGLIPGYRVADYRRTARIKATTISGKAGFAGAFRQLVSEHPDLQAFVERAVQRNPGKQAALIARHIKKSFLVVCAKYRAPNEYPFIVSDEGRRSLVAYINGLQVTLLADAASLGKDTEEIFEGPRTGQPSGAQLLRPYEEVELDGHKGDFYFVLKVRSNGDRWLYTTPLRIWLLIAVDRASRALLGYSYRLGGTNYSSLDVLRCIAHTLTPWVAKDITLPKLDYKSGGGFPNSCTPLGAGRMIDCFHVDNAWANTARQVRSCLTQVIGATLNVGRARTPVARPFVERLNKTLEDRGFRTLPTGFEAISKEDRDQAFKVASKYPITIDEFEQVLDVMLANYNAELHSEHVNRSPLEFLRVWDAATESPLRKSEDIGQLLATMSTFVGYAQVKGGSGRLPFFRFKGADYTCTRLKQLRSSVGRRVRVCASLFGDARHVRAFLQINDSEVDLGVASAMPPWHLTPLSFAQRRLVLAERRRGLLPVVPGTDAGGAFVYVREREAAEKKGNANRLVKFGPSVGASSAKVAQRPSARDRVRPKDWIKVE